MPMENIGESNKLAIQMILRCFLFQEHSSLRMKNKIVPNSLDFSPADE